MIKIVVEPIIHSGELVGVKKTTRILGFTVRVKRLIYPPKEILTDGWIYHSDI